MSFNNQEKIGVLKNPLSLTFHTKDAMKLIRGRQRSDTQDDEKYAINGLDLFSVKVNNLWQRIKKDDPYAEMTLIEIERRLSNVKEKIAQQLKETEAKLKEAPSGITVGITESINPLTIVLDSPRYYTTHTKLLAVLIAQFDQLIRQFHSCMSIGLISKTQYNRQKRTLVGNIRSVLIAPNLYKNNNVTREDIVKLTETGRAAIQRFGTLPIPILKNTQHSEYGPVSEKI